MTTPSGGQSLLGYASTLLGVPYRWGGTDPSTGLDCSGFVQNVYAHAGINLPRTSQQQVNVGSAVSYKQAQPGDLVFYYEPGQGAGHVGIYLGNGKMMDAPHTGASVQIEPIWQGAFFRRVAGQGVNIGVVDPTGAGGETGNADGSASGVNAPHAQHYNMAELENQYGYAAKFFLGDSTLHKLINKAVKEQWSPDQFAAELKGTKWYQTHTDAQRNWIQLQTSDPASAQRQLGMQATDIQRLATQEGVHLDSNTVKAIALDALRNGLNSDQIRQAVVSHLTVDTTNAAGTAALGGNAQATYSQLKQWSHDYGVPMTEQAFDTWTTKIQTGADTSDGYKQYLISQAKQMYPGIANQISDTSDVYTATDSYRKLMAQTLEIPEEDITLGDQTLKKALSYTPTDSQGNQTGSGTPGLQPLWSFEQSLKQDPRWMQTQNARDSMMGTALQIGKDFGFYGGSAG